MSSQSAAFIARLYISILPPAPLHTTVLAVQTIFTNAVMAGFGSNTIVLFYIWTTGTLQAFGSIISTISESLVPRCPSQLVTKSAVPNRSQ